jgi:hypothetical protein
MLILDSFAGHKTTEVKDACRHYIDICMIPGGCTKYLQPLDLTVNRRYKCMLKDGYAMMMKTYTGEIDKSRKQSASKINCIDLTANLIQSAKAVTRECVIRGWRKMTRGPLNPKKSTRVRNGQAIVAQVCAIFTANCNWLKAAWSTLQC